MTFIETVPEDQATGATAEIYATDRGALGQLPNFTQAFSLRPEVYAAWRGLNAAIKSDMDLRRYELATIAAARRLRSSYCMLAHGSVLLEQFLDADDLRTVVGDDPGAALDQTEVAIMELATQVVDDATAIDQADIDRLRSLGLTDKDIMSVILAAAARCFFSKALDALGAQPDAKYAALDPSLRDALTVGRPIAQA